MARPTSTSVRKPGNYTPAAANAPAPVVAMPINAQVNSGGADALAQALGVIGQVVQQRDQSAEQSGKADAALNQVDAERARKSAAYARGAGDIEAERQTIGFLTQWQSHYEAEIAKGTPADEVQKDFDDRARESLGHWLDDPRAKAIVGEKLFPFITKTLASHVQAQTQERNAEAVAVVTASIQFDLNNTGTTDFAKQFEKLAPMIGNSAAKRAVVEAIANVASTNGNAALLDAIPEEITLKDGQKIRGPRADAAFADVLHGAREKADAQATQNRHADRELYRAPLTQRWQENPLAFTRQDYDRELKKEGVAEDFTQSELDTWWARRLAELERLAKEKQIGATYAMNPNMRLRYIPGTPKPDGTFWTQTEAEVEGMSFRVAAALKANPPREGEDENAHLWRVASQVSAVEGIPYKPLAEALQAAPPSDPQYEREAAAYRNLSPANRALYVPSDEKRAEFERYWQLRDMGKNHRDAAEALVVRSSEVVKANTAAHAKAWGEEQKSLLKLEVNTRGRNAALQDVANRDQVLRRIYDAAQLRIEGGMPPKDAVEKAREQVLQSLYFVRGPSKGQHLLLPIESGLTLEDAAPALEDFYAKTIKDGTYLSTYPGSPDNTTLVLIDASTGYPLEGSKKFNLRTIVQAYTEAQASKAHDKATQRNRLVNDPYYNQQGTTPNPDGNIRDFIK